MLAIASPQAKEHLLRFLPLCVESHLPFDTFDPFLLKEGGELGEILLHVFIGAFGDESGGKRIDKRESENG